jgi:hypothetical protein
MLFMNKDEVEQETHKWPANIKQPIDRDAQITFMKTAKERHENWINNVMKQLENERKRT